MEDKDVSMCLARCESTHLVQGQRGTVAQALREAAAPENVVQRLVIHQDLQISWFTPRPGCALLYQAVTPFTHLVLLRRVLCAAKQFRREEGLDVRDAHVGNDAVSPPVATAGWSRHMTNA